MLSKATELKIMAITDSKLAIDSVNSTSLVSDKGCELRWKHSVSTKQTLRSTTNM